MTQVKVIFDPSLLKSEQPMAEAIYRLQIQEENFFFSQSWLGSLMPTPSAPQPVKGEIYMEGLLRPPGIDSVEIDDYEGETDPIVFISADEGVGKIDIFVSVVDEQGKLVESGPAFYIPGSGTEWAFTILEPVPPETPVDVSIHVVDCVGGVRVEHHRLTIP
jgi:hypothetical protein